MLCIYGRVLRWTHGRIEITGLQTDSKMAPIHVKENCSTSALYMLISVSPAMPTDFTDEIPFFLQI